MNANGLQGGQGRLPDDLRDDAICFGLIILVALFLVMLAGCNAFSRLYME